MIALIITSLLGDYSGIAEESNEVVSIHQSTCFPGM